ncbi:MAG: right-handed parallel beta-helix repeat-containing protein [Rhodanobacteraceae bacterium]
MKRIVAVLPWLLLPLHALATDFSVDLTSVDAVDANPGDGVCQIAAVTPPAPGCTLRAAVMEANALSGADRIIVPFGANIVFSLAGKNEDLAATGDLDIVDAVTIQTPSVPTSLADYARIDANGLDRVLEIASSNTHLQGLIITGGVANTASSAIGGGIRSSGSSLTIEDSIITGNLANTGGAINAQGTLDISRTRIYDNTSANLGFTNAYGCAIHDTDSGSFPGDSIHIRNSSIDHNTCGTGAALQLRTNLQIENSTISDNAAQVALGMYNADAMLNQVTIVGSQVGYSIASFDGSAVSSVHNSIIVGENFNPACSIGNALVDHRWTLASDSSCQLAAGPGNLASTDPMLGPLATRYSLLPVRQPAAASPVIDAADPTIGGTCLPEDEDGLPRPIDGDGDGTALCDMGAVELDDVIFANGFD